MPDPSNQKVSVANGVATAVLIWAILYDRSPIRRGGWL
jgi:hypothetical protein